MVLSKRSASARPAKRAMATWLPKASWIHRRFVGGSDLELRFEQPLVMAFARTQHHPVFAEGDRLLVLIGGDMPDGENRHCKPMIRLWIACIFRAKQGRRQ